MQEKNQKLKIYIYIYIEREREREKPFVCEKIKNNAWNERENNKFIV